MIEAVKSRLADDSMEVVLAVLEIPCLVDIFGGKEGMCEMVIDLLDTTPRSKWSRYSLGVALDLLCSNFE